MIKKLSIVLCIAIIILLIPIVTKDKVHKGILINSPVRKEYNIKKLVENKSFIFTKNTYTKEKETNKVEAEKIKKTKVAYLTIDDGPSKYTSEILDILKENNAYATFFMIDKNMNTYKDEVNRIANEGHGAGFHSVSHDVKSLYKTNTSAKEEFDKCKETFKSITGKESNLLRLPYGSKPYASEESYNELVNGGYMVWDWNLDTEDWKSNKDRIINNILYYARDKDEFVILMHEKEQTVSALDGMIKVLKERGYEILPITNTQEQQNFFNRKLK